MAARDRTRAAALRAAARRSPRPGRNRAPSTRSRAHGGAGTRGRRLARRRRAAGRRLARGLARRRLAALLARRRTAVARAQTFRLEPRLEAVEFRARAWHRVVGLARRTAGLRRRVAEIFRVGNDVAE